MPRSSTPSGAGPRPPGGSDADGPRAILRVPEALMAIAGRSDGISLAELAPRLGVPKTSLHRLLRTLERGGYVASQGGLFRLGPASFQLASLIGRSAPASAFPACARPTLEWLAHETRETIMLGVLSGSPPEILYVDVIDSHEPVRFTVPVGDLRPLYCAASGKAALAFLPAQDQMDYLARTAFTAFTPDTTRKDEMPALLQAIREGGVAFDHSGRVSDASGMASPIFDGDGKAFGSISVAGPTERMEANRARLAPLVLSAGETISRLLGFAGDYPPR